MSNLNRRDFLKLAGKVSLGAVAVAAIPAAASADAEIAAPAFPWTWPGLDVKEVQDKVYANFFAKGGCCAGVASGILDLLAEKYGYPYNQIDGRMFAHGGGGYGRRNLCGSLGGAFAVLNLFATGADMSGIRTKIYEWYESTNLPIYQPADKPEHTVHTVAGSELCKDSVGNWMAASGFEFGSPERGVRCASLSADVAGQLVQHLNVLYGFAAAPEAPAEEAPAAAGNVYHGVGECGFGVVEVDVTMDGDKIASIVVTKNTTDFAPADSVITSIISGNGVDGVDTKTGATATANALVAAVQDALSKVQK